VRIRRDAVMDDLGSSVPEVSVEFFLRYTAPWVNNIVCTSLRQLTSKILLVAESGDNMGDNDEEGEAMEASWTPFSPQLR
jgi:hypothetical protein